MFERLFRKGVMISMCGDNVKIDNSGIHILWSQNDFDNKMRSVLLSHLRLKKLQFTEYQRRGKGQNNSRNGNYDGHLL